MKVWNRSLLKIYVAITMSFSVFIACASGESFQTVETLRILEKEGTPSQPLSNFLSKLGIQHDNSLATIVEQTQKAWLRPPTSERFTLKENEADALRKAELKPYFQTLGLHDRITPFHDYYDYCLVLGSTVQNVRERLAYLALIWQSGMRFKELVFLTGARILDPVTENESALIDSNQTVLPVKPGWKLVQLPRTEAEMMHMVFAQSVFPVGLASLAPKIINAPLKQLADGTTTRPNTGDTVHAWLSTKPQKGTCVVISNQPYVGYQHSVMRTLLPSYFPVDTVGDVLSYDDEPLVILLDTVARWLYQERKRLGL